jgi:hypothetical protein
MVREVPQMAGMTGFQINPICGYIRINLHPFWPMLASPKHLSLVKVITTNIWVNKLPDSLRQIYKTYKAEGSIRAWDVEGVIHGVSFCGHSTVNIYVNRMATQMEGNVGMHAAGQCILVQNVEQLIHGSSFCGLCVV